MKRKIRIQSKIRKGIAAAVGMSLLLAGCGSSVADTASLKTDSPVTMKEKAVDEQAAEQGLQTPEVKDGVPQLDPDAIEVYFVWDAIEGADGYEVTSENKFCESDTYGDSETTETKEPNFTVGAQDDFDFRIQVRAFRGEGSDRIYSDWSNYAEGKTYGEEVERLLAEEQDKENTSGELYDMATATADSLYRELLVKYLTAVDEKWDEGKCEAEKLCPVCNISDLKADQIEYALMDLNWDGKDELLIFANKTEEGSFYQNNYVCGLYTTVGNTIEPLFTNLFGPRDDGWYLMQNGSFCIKLGGTGMVLYSFGRLGDDGKLHGTESYGVGYMAEGDPEYYYCEEDAALGNWFFDEGDYKYTTSDEEAFTEAEKQFDAGANCVIAKYTLEEFRALNDAKSDAAETIAADPELTKALSGYWYSFGLGSVFDGTDSDGNPVEVGIAPRSCVVFKDGLVYSYCSPTPECYPASTVGIDRIHSVEKKDDGTILVRIEDFLRPGRQYTYAGKVGVSDTMDFYGTWEEADFPDQYSGTGSIERRDDYQKPEE